MIIMRGMPPLAYALKPMLRRSLKLAWIQGILLPFTYFNSSFIENFKTKFARIKRSCLEIETKEDAGRFALDVKLSRGSDEMDLRRAIALRNPYVDPISLVQVDCLRRWRATGREDAALEGVLMETVRGIARGMQNTG